MNDLISRKDAIKAIDKDIMGGLNYKSILNKLPSVEPERKKGKWIDKSGGIEGAWNYCSICGEQAVDLYDFCPNCGAQMVINGKDLLIYLIKKKNY